MNGSDENKTVSKQTVHIHSSLKHEWVNKQIRANAQKIHILGNSH